MAIDFKTVIGIVPHVLNVRKPVLFRGRHGVGKSEVIYQIADELGMLVVERRASQMTEGDLIGLPSTDGNVTSFNPPDWYNECCEESRILFLDEIDRATTEVRQGIFELTDSRKLNGHKLHPDTIIFAAVNGGEHGAQYQVGEMDPAELDRWTVFDLEPTVEDWLDWAKDNVETVVWDFINNHRAHLEHDKEFEPNKVYPSRRSWKRLNDCLCLAGLLETTSETLYHLTAAFVGFEAAVSFNDFVANYSKVVTVEDILDDGKIELTEEFGVNEHSALVEKFEASGVFNDVLPDNRADNLAAYFVTLPSEVAMKLWTVIGQANQDNAIKLHGAEAPSGVRISEVLVEMLTGKSVAQHAGLP
jgi:hypothetical protein